MKRVFRPALFLLFALPLVQPFAWSADDEIHWLGDYQEALKEARRTGKPIFVEFRCEA
jgi:hypothetical protein